mmetsp:Transcript_63852/g.114009  ORF Transcript_63852/g.114009 Transcript_63852/m.114009 type:complete len:88 (+) Transcript_63852:68-331(+)
MILWSIHGTPDPDIHKQTQATTATICPLAHLATERLSPQCHLCAAMQAMPQRPQSPTVHALLSCQTRGPSTLPKEKASLSSHIPFVS